MQARLLAAVVLTLLQAAARAQACVEPAADPANTYDAPHTYAKLVRDYPFIRIASAALPAQVRRVADQVYVRYGQRCLALDLYLPATAPSAAMPVVLLVHGGGWRYGYRSEFAPLAVRLAQRGVAAATISYRLAGEAPYPAAMHDVRAAVRWVRSHAAQFGIDGQRVVLAGGSAGGQIASLAGVTGALPEFDAPQLEPAQRAVSSAVQAIVNIDGLSDLTLPAARVYEDDPGKLSSLGLWLGGRYAEQVGRWREASPIQYVRAGMPPILFIDSAQPRFALGRDQMRAAMAQAGVSSRLLMLPETPHSFWLFDPWLQPTLDAIVDFLPAR
ncbi:MAG: alpha/beta fold hydrolase [Sphingomonadaceae bacterium]